MGNDFHNDFFGKIVVKIFVVCEGLNNENLTVFPGVCFDDVIKRTFFILVTDTIRGRLG